MHEETSEEPVMDIQAGKHHCLDEKNLTSNCRQKCMLWGIFVKQKWQNWIFKVGSGREYSESWPGRGETELL